MTPVGAGSQRGRGALILLVVALAATPGNALAQFQKAYRVDVIADDVFAIVWDDLRNFPVEGNHLVVVGESDVVVVDANRTPSLADTVIAIIRRRTGKGVSHVINTHWHADHVQGNSVYRAAFPNVKIVGHPETVAGMDSVLVPYVEEVGHDLESVRAQLRPADEAGGELDEEARSRLDARLVGLEREATLYDAVVFDPPTTLVSDSLVLETGGQKIVVLHSGPANTPGDLTVWLPESRILAVGDIVTRPFPLLGWDTPAGWHRSLTALLDRGPRVVLPGHGEVLRSMEYAELFRDLMGSVSSQVRQGIADGQTLEQLQTGADLSEYWREFSDGDERLFQAFETRFQPVLVERAFLEAGTRP